MSQQFPPQPDEPQPDDAHPGADSVPTNVPPGPVHSEAPVDLHKQKANDNGWFYVDLDNKAYTIPDEVLELMKARDARTYNAIPVVLRGRQVNVAVENPDDLVLSSNLRPLFAGYTMRLVYANPAAIRRKIEEVYSASTEAAALAKQRDAAKPKTTRESEGGDLGRIEAGAESSNNALLRLIIEQALRDKSSDVHIEPTETHLEVRYRVDGKLRVAGRYPSSRAQGLLTLIKVESGMKTDNFLMPDSGVMQHRVPGGKPVDIRVETAPTAWGTSCVMRLQSEIWRPLSTLGFSEGNEKRFRDAIAQPYGIILATGPTGSGKSTTLYSSLREKIDPETKIITLENPIEFKVPVGISQMAINDQQGMTFAGGLRSILRQDPDVVLVGEIRDQETAETAVDAAMTGHLVFSTLHTNDAPGVIPRLTRMGIEPFMLSSSLLCAVGQRLVRRLCQTCKIVHDIREEEISSYGFDVTDLPEVFYTNSPDGCMDCLGRGFSGRVPIHEVMVVNMELSDAIADDAPQVEILRQAKKAGMTTMREDGFLKAKQGMTSVTEINNNTRRELV